MLFELSIISLSICVIVIIKKITGKRPAPLFNVYQVEKPFNSIKVAFMYIMIKLQRLRPKKLNIHEVDKEQKLSSSDSPIDAVYFPSFNSDKEFLFLGMARRKPNLIDGFLMIKIGNYGLLELPKLPKTDLRQKENEEGYQAEGLQIRPVEAMKKWKIDYEGKLRDQSGKLHDVSVDMLWESYMPYFNYDTDVDAHLLAQAIARETWSKDYFETLKFVHQTHYEQHGNVYGIIKVDNNTHVVHMNSLRDHSFGYQRKWANFHRYALHFLTVENGDRISVSAISMPICFSSLYVGFIYIKKYDKCYPIQSCDLLLYQHGENQPPPKCYSFSFIANDERYQIDVTVEDRPAFFISEKCEAKVYEQYCTVKVNNKKGWGCTEWEYRNPSGKVE